MRQSVPSLSATARSVAVTGLLLNLFLAAFDSTVVGTAMPRILRELGGLERYTWVTVAYLLTSTVTVPLAGKLSDLYGRKRLLLVGTSLFLFTSALCGLASDLNQLILFRALQGIGGGAITAGVFAAVPDLFSPTARARLVGLFTATYGLASIVGPLLGGFLTDLAGWRSVFFINLPLAAAAMSVLWWAYPARPVTQRRTQLDYLGGLTLVAGVGPLLLAFSVGGRQLAWGSPTEIGLIAFAALMLLLFVWIEAHAVDPIIPLSLLRSRSAGLPVLGMALMGVGMFGAALFVPLFVQEVLGHGASTSGAALAPLMLAFVAASVLMSQIIARIGRYRVAGVVGMAIAALGLGLLSTMGPTTSDGELVRTLIITGLGLGSALSAFTIASQNAVPLQLMGVATALGTFARAIGGTVGSAGLGAVLAGALQTSVGGAPSPDLLAGSLHGVFLIAAIVVLVGAALVLFVEEVPLRRRTPAASSAAGSPGTDASIARAQPAVRPGLVDAPTN